MAVREVVRRKLRLDVRNGDIATDAYILAVGNLRKPEIQVVHDGVETVSPSAIQVLIAEDAVAERVLVIRTVQAGETSAPIEMIALNFIGRALDVQRRLIELHGIGLERIGRRKVAARAIRVVEPRTRRTDVAAWLDPAVDREAAILQFLAALAARQRVHQRAVVHVLDADGLRTADVP